MGQGEPSGSGPTTALNFGDSAVTGIVANSPKNPIISKQTRWCLLACRQRGLFCKYETEFGFLQRSLS